MNIRHLVVLCGGLLGSEPLLAAQPAARAVGGGPASPDSALVHLTAARVSADTMQRPGLGVCWRY